MDPYPFCDKCGADEDLSYCSSCRKTLCIECDLANHKTLLKQFALYP